MTMAPLTAHDPVIFSTTCGFIVVVVPGAVRLPAVTVPADPALRFIVAFPVGAGAAEFANVTVQPVHVVL